MLSHCQVIMNTGSQTKTEVLASIRCANPSNIPPSSFPIKCHVILPYTVVMSSHPVRSMLPLMLLKVRNNKVYNQLL